MCVCHSGWPWRTASACARVSRPDPLTPAVEPVKATLEGAGPLVVLSTDFSLADTLTHAHSRDKLMATPSCNPLHEYS